MKSKTSFFNRTVFKKNVTLYWPIWVCYLLYGMVKVPETRHIELTTIYYIKYVLKMFD